MSLNKAASCSEKLYWSFQFAARHCHWLHRRFFFLCVAKAFSIASFISPRGFPRIISGIYFLLCLVSLICEEDFLQNNNSLFFLRMLASSLRKFLLSHDLLPWALEYFTSILYVIEFEFFLREAQCALPTNLMTCSVGCSRDIFSFVHLVSSIPLQCMKKSYPLTWYLVDGLWSEDFRSEP